MTKELKVAVVTGAQSGIGRAVCRALADDGHAVVVNYIEDQPAADGLVSRLTQMGANAVAVKADISEETSVRLLVDSIERRYGRITVLVNNAAISTQATLDEETTAGWASTLQTNLTGPFLCSKAVSRLMGREGFGRIINISSISAFRFWKGTLGYSVSKAALNMLTKGLACELAPLGVTVNAIAPGPVDTPMLHRDVGANDLAAVKRRIPLGRLGTPEDIASLVAFLSSKAAGWITGEVITADGGYSIVGDP